MLEKRKTQAETVKRHPKTGAPISDARRKNKPVLRPKPAHYKKYRPEEPEQDRQERPRIVKHESPSCAETKQEQRTPLDDFDEEAYLAERAQEKKNSGADVLDFPSGQGVTASKKAAQKPAVLMEDDETAYRRDVLGLDDSTEQGRKTPTKAIGIPDISDDPEVLAAQEELKAAEYKLQRLEAQKKLMAMLNQGPEMDPDHVEQLCQDEPWMRSRSLEGMSVSDFGFVPNKFKYLRDQFEEGTVEHTRYAEALEKSYKLYDEQVTRAARRQFNKLAAQHDTPQKIRAAAENMNARINAFRKAANLEGDHLFSYQSGLLMRAMICLGHHVMNNNGGHRWGQGVTEDGRKYESFSLKPGKDGPDIKPL